MARVNSPAFWDELYARGGDAWELGRPAPPLVDFVEATPPPRGRVAVVGCGRGHDARYLARRGFDAIGFDFAAPAIAEARRLAAAERVAVDFQRRDVFTLGRDYANAFDGVWEYACFCALEPRRRREYVAALASIVKPGGWLLACFFPMRRLRPSPPYPVSRAEIRRLLPPAFRIERTLSPASVPRRLGQEWLVWARRTGAPA